MSARALRDIARLAFFLSFKFCVLPTSEPEDSPAQR
jgi:hypothetical protein